MEDNLEKYEELKNCRREPDQKIDDYIHEFEKYNRILKKGIKLLEGILLVTLQYQKKCWFLSGINFAKREFN